MTLPIQIGSIGYQENALRSANSLSLDNKGIPQQIPKNKHKYKYD